jgi:hypothetical protein
MSRELQELAVSALHKLAVEYGRGTVAPRYEYDAALERLAEMKSALFMTEREDA